MSNEENGRQEARRQRKIKGFENQTETKLLILSSTPGPQSSLCTTQKSELHI